MVVILAIIFGVFLTWGLNRLRQDEAERRAERKRLGLKRDDGYIWDQKGRFWW
jgi:hypothetical protein